MKYIEEEITLAELAERFLLINDFKTPNVYDMKDIDVEILSYNKDKQCDEWKKINSFVVKDNVNKYYSDGKLNGTENHRIIENNNEIFLRDHKDFNLIEEQMDVVDIEVEDNQNYYANGRLNHNTTTGGNATKFFASVRIKLQKGTKLKKKGKFGKDEVIGVGAKATIIKTKLGPAFREAEFDIYFKNGIDDVSSWIPYLESEGIMWVSKVNGEESKSGQYYTIDLSKLGLKNENKTILRKEFKGLISSNKELGDLLKSTVERINVVDWDADELTEDMKIELIRDDDYTTEEQLPDERHIVDDDEDD